MFFFKTQTERLRDKASKQLEEYSRPSIDFFVLIALASCIATIGIIVNNIAIIIGAMVVAPLITPIFWFSLALIVLRLKSVLTAFATIIIGSLLAIAISSVFTYIVALIQQQPIVLSNTVVNIESNVLFFLVALFSGMAGAYAYARPNRSAALPGIAIAVTVIPPLCITGAAIALRAWDMSMQSFILYLFNLVGICFGSILVFIITGFGNNTQKIQLKK